MTAKSPAQPKRTTECRIWVKMRKTQREQIRSGMPTKPTSMTGVATSLNGMDRPRSGPTTSEYACGATKTRRHAMPRKVGTAIVTIGIDPGKNTMHLVGLDARGEIVLREKVARTKIVSRLAAMSPRRGGDDGGTG